MPARRSGIASGALAISLLMPACQGAEPAPSSTAEPTSAPSNAPATPATTARSAAGSLVVTLDGKPLALPHAAAVKGNASSIWLQLSDQPLECSDLRPHDLQNLGKRLQLLLSPKLQADGSKVWKVAASRMRGLPMRFATAKGEQKVAVRGSVDGTVEVELKATLLERPHGPVELRGKVAAKGCGTKPQAGLPKPRPQTNLTLELAKQRFEVKSALLREKDGKRTIDLSSGRRGCKRQRPDEDLRVELSLTDEPTRIQKVDLSGTLIEGSRGASFTPKGEVKIGGDAKAEIRFEGEVMGFPLQVSGTAELERCPN